MSELNLEIITIAGDLHTISAPSDITASDLLYELSIAFGFPIQDAEGDAITWRLDNKITGITLDGEKTLEQNGVLEGQTLTLQRATYAGGPGIKLVAKGTSVREFTGKSQENIYGLEDGYLLIPQVLLPLLREHIENDPVTKWIDRSIGFFLGACLAFLIPIMDDKLSSSFRGILDGALFISLLAAVVLIVLEIKVENRRKKVIRPLIERLSEEPKCNDEVAHQENRSEQAGGST